MKNDVEFVTAFSECRLKAIDHEEHVRLAWIILQRTPLLEAIHWLVDGFSKFAKAKGKPEVYHETITWAFTILINKCLERFGRDTDQEQFAFESPDLFRGQMLLDDLYQACALKSSLARRTFVFPDRCR